MAFVHRDVLIDLIERISTGLARTVLGRGVDDDNDGLPGIDPDSESVARAAGLSLEVAAVLPASTIAQLVGHQPARIQLLGLALGRRAWRAADPSVAARALDLLELAGPAVTDDDRDTRTALTELAIDH